MSLAEEVKRVLLENPQILVEVLMAKPEIIYQVLAKLTPWQNLATKQDIEELRRTMATKEELEELRRDVEELRKRVDNIESKMATKEDIKRLEERINNIESKMATKDDLKNMATKDDVKRLELTITALGARWGIMSEEAFRDGISEILRNTGWSVSREILYDKDGYVYGEPSDVEYNVVIKDGKTILIEITSSLKRGDLPIIRKKKELYERIRNTRIDLVYVITPFVHDKYPERVRAMAKDMGIDIVYPTP